eukprot:TRINITY_DN8870_c0_g1_i1.p1 TRINITY_DN8870_c0_g1~~TRINITY_DN8870_c0_g1_i1.p1  ORF type:complete len:421 (+),score=39.30 TRINITY_DN8870_c0_g1_i1:26-1264(+)
MQLSVSFPDSGYPDVLFVATTDSVVKDAAEAAAEEWDINSEFLDISFCGEVVKRRTKLLSLGVEMDSQLTASLLPWTTKSLLTEEATRECVILLSKNQTLHLDTPTFADASGQVQFTSSWVNGFSIIEFANPASTVMSIGNEFLKATGVVNIDLSGFQYVEHIGHHFLAKCSSLTSVNLSALCNVTEIGDYFLCWHQQLTSVDLSGLRKVVSVGSYFLQGTSVDTLNLSALTVVTSIGKGLLQTLTVSELDLLGFGSLAHVEDCFLEYSSAAVVEFSVNPKNLTSVGHYTLTHCRSLKEVSFPGLVNVTVIGDQFLSNCHSLTKVDLEGLTNVTSIGNGFLNSNPRLQSVDLSGLSNLVSIGDTFLSNCGSLREANLDTLRNVTSVGTFPLARCPLFSMSIRMRFINFVRRK